MIVGIYGKSGSGKTYLASKLKKQNFYIINVDFVAKLVLKKYEKKIIDELPFLNENNFLKIEKLKFIIFNSISKCLKFNYTFSFYLSKYLKILENDNRIFILDGAIVNLLNLKFDYLFYIDTINICRIRKKGKIIGKNNIISLLNVQNWFINPNNFSINFFNVFFLSKIIILRKIIMMIKNYKN